MNRTDPGQSHVEDTRETTRGLAAVFCALSRSVHEYGQSTFQLCTSSGSVTAVRRPGSYASVCCPAVFRDEHEVAPVEGSPKRRWERPQRGQARDEYGTDQKRSHRHQNIPRCVPGRSRDAILSPTLAICVKEREDPRGGHEGRSSPTPVRPPSLIWTVLSTASGTRTFRVGRETPGRSHVKGTNERMAAWLPSSVPLRQNGREY